MSSRQHEAAGKVAAAVKRGDLPRLGEDAEIPCADCGKPAAQYDHRDYLRPLDVAPVCKGCNKRRGPGANDTPRNGRAKKRSVDIFAGMHSFAGIVATAGGPAELARQFATAGVAVPRTRINQWSAKDTIPAPYWTTLMKLAVQWSPPRTLTADHLASLAARKLRA